MRALCFTAIVLLAGCSDTALPVAKTKKVDRKAAAEVALSKTPVPRTYAIQGNQLQVIEIPAADMSGFVEIQRCFVWRDLEFKTASISCPQPPEMVYTRSDQSEYR